MLHAFFISNSNLSFISLFYIIFAPINQNNNTMKRFFIPLLTLLLAFACTPDNGGNEGNGNNSNNGSGEYVPTGKITVKGTVYGSDGPLSGVVVSDGLLCVRTNDNGYYVRYIRPDQEFSVSKVRYTGYTCS